MSDENNYYENKEETQYTQVPDSGPVYQQDNGSDYGSTKGQGIGLGIASMVLGIVSILISCCGLWYISLVTGIVGIILGIVQIVKNQSKGMAIAGIVCGALGIIFGLIVLFGSIALLSSDFYQELLNEAGYSF